MSLKTIASALFLVVVGLALVYLPQSKGFAATADEIVGACASAGDSPACYEDRVASLYPEHSIAEVFEIVRSIRAKDPAYQFCHVLAHKLGERVVAEDPDRWIDAIPLNPADGLCSNGFIHGVVGGRFRAEVLDDATLNALIPDFARACEPRADWHPTRLDQSICYHGLGHLYVFITDADIYRSLSVCDATIPEEYRRLCVEGVFMQIYQPLEPDDYLMLERMERRPKTASEVRPYCATYTEDAYEGACLRESWPLFRESLMDGSGVAAFCAGQPNAKEEESCFQSTLGILGRLTLGNADAIVETCAHVPESQQGLCYTSAARAIIEEERSQGARAIEMCTRAPRVPAAACLEEMSRTAGFMYGSGSREHAQFCALLPAEYHQACLAS